MYVRNNKYKLYPNSQTTLSHNVHNIVVIKSKEQGLERYKHKITRAHVIEEETEEVGQKPLCRPPSSKMIH